MDQNTLDMVQITAYVSHVQLFPNFGQQEINVAVAQYLGLV